LEIGLVSERVGSLVSLWGGQSGHVMALAVALARRGHTVTVYTRREDVRLPDSVPYARGVTVEHVRAGPARPVTRDELPPYVTEFGERLAERWLSRPPDVVHAHFWMSGLAALRAVRGRGVPVVQTFHGLGSAELRHRRDAGIGTAERLRLEAQVGLASSAVIATCTDEAAELGAYGISARATTVVPCGVDTRRFRPEGPVTARGDRPRVLTVGRLSAGSGVDTVVEALCHVPDTELVVAGGPGRTEMYGDAEVLRLRRLATDRGVGDRVLFAGRVRGEDMPALVRSADAVVSVPWYTPSGMGALEAMACGVPVVASAVGAHLDTVVDGVTGLHVAPGLPGALAGRLRRVLGDPRLGGVLGSAAAARVRERYGWERIAGETEAVYHRVVEEAEGLMAADGTCS
jgi:D-inositol-3-phosphate glycosyltransferase